MKAAHNLDIEGLKGVASRLNKEDTGMNAVVNNVHAVDLVLGIKVSVKSLLNVVDNRTPRLVIVDKVTESRGIDDCQTETDTGLLNIGAD